MYHFGQINQQYQNEEVLACVCLLEQGCLRNCVCGSVYFNIVILFGIVLCWTSDRHHMYNNKKLRLKKKNRKTVLNLKLLNNRN